MQEFEMNDEMRSASEIIAIALMTPKLREAEIDLTDMDAVREALVAARFGERLIENCAEQAAVEAAKPAPTWAPFPVLPESRQERAVFEHFGKRLVEEGADPDDQDAVMAVISRTGFGAEMAHRVAVGAAQAAMEAAYA